jgi:polyketide cyclase/dehydrase/lipid transport protein
MFSRVVIMLTFAATVVLAPTIAIADTSANPGASAAGLGPASNSGVDTGGSSADSSTLQPAGTSPLQSSTNASTGLTAPTSNALQAPASDSGTLQVIEGQADGDTHQLGGGSTSTWTWLWWLIGIIVVIAIGAVIWRRRASAPSGTVAPEPAAEPTRSQTLTITINRPASDIFHYTLDPANTPKWIDFIVAEEANEEPPKLGTQYKNQNASGEWTEYELIGFEPPEHFTLARIGGSYRVKYTFTPVATPENDPSDSGQDNQDATKVEYHEWVEEGELTHPFPPEALQKLKSVLEEAQDARDESPA